MCWFLCEIIHACFYSVYVHDLSTWILCSVWHLAFCFLHFQNYVGNRILGAQERFQSSYLGSIARRARNADEAAEVAYLKELYHRNDPEAVIRVFESQPSLHNSPSALSEYVKALVKVDRLDESELLKTLRRGAYFG